MGVSRSADLKTIRAAFRKLSKKYHPDVSLEIETYEKIREAFDVLSDETKRLRYDSCKLNDKQFTTAINNVISILNQLFVQKITNEKQIKECLYQFFEKEMVKINQELTRVNGDIARSQLMLDELQADNFFMEELSKTITGSQGELYKEKGLIEEKIAFLEAQIGLIPLLSMKTKDKPPTSDYHSMFYRTTASSSSIIMPVDNNPYNFT